MVLDETNKCPLCQSHINYNQTIHEFSDKKVSRVQLNPQPNALLRRTPNEAILRLHQEAVWMKLALYENASQNKTLTRQNASSLTSIDILIDTGAALSLIREDIIVHWKRTHPQNIRLQDTTQKAETCSGIQLHITNKCTIYNCTLSGGPPLSLEFYVCSDLFCEALLGLPEMRIRQSTINLRTFVFSYSLTKMDPGYKEGRIGKGPTSPILPRLKQPILVAPLGQVTIPCIGHLNISLQPQQLKVIGYPLIPVRTLTKGKACYVTLINPRVHNVKINPSNLQFAMKQQQDSPKPILKGSKNWLNTTLEEYGDFIFTYGRYNTLENLDLKIRENLGIIDTIKDNHTLENQNHPFGKGTHAGNLLIGLLMEIYRSTYHLETPLETLLNKAENIPSIMKVSPTSEQNSLVTWFYPTLKTIREHHQKIRIDQLYVKVPRLLCSVGLQVISRLSISETNPKSNFFNPNIEKKLSREAHRAFYQLSLLWAITGACIKDIINRFHIKLHPFFKLNTRFNPELTTQPPPPKNKETNWKNILDKANIGATTKSNLATPVDQILNLPNSSNYPPSCPNEDSIKGFEERILQKHQEMKEQAKQEYGHPNKFKHIKGAPITHLCPEDLPALAAYAASP